VALTLQPDNPWVVNMLGVAYARLGEWGRAVASCERALVLVPYSQLARDNLARVLAHEQPALTSEGP
jgi:Flp pilus assembly protein TadD